MTRFHPFSRASALALAVACLAAPAVSRSTEGPWLVRARAVYLDPANTDNTGLDLAINSRFIPEVDVTCFFTPHLAAELVLTSPQKQDIRAGGTRIGTLRHLPPTLSLQYHFTPDSPIRPYVGAGVNYTRFSRVHFDPAIEAALQPTIERHSLGLSLGAGVDYQLTGPWFLNLDVKKVHMDTDVRAAGVKVGTFKVNPMLWSVGLGYRF